MLSDWNWVHRFRVSGSMAKKAGFVTKASAAISMVDEDARNFVITFSPSSKDRVVRRTIISLTNR
jgi:hypothetical protein